MAVYEPRADELEYALKVLKAYQSMGYPVHFSRIDLIDAEAGPTLVEAELLNPSIYANYSRRGPEFGEQIAGYFDRLIQTQAKLTPITAAWSSQSSPARLIS